MLPNEVEVVAYNAYFFTLFTIPEGQQNKYGWANFWPNLAKFDPNGPQESFLILEPPKFDSVPLEPFRTTSLLGPSSPKLFAAFQELCRGYAWYNFQLDLVIDSLKRLAGLLAAACRSWCNLFNWVYMKRCSLTCISGTVLQFSYYISFKKLGCLQTK